MSPYFGRGVRYKNSTHSFALDINCNITYSFVAKVIYTLLLSRKWFTHFCCRENNLCTFLSRKLFTHLFCRKNNLRTFLSQKRFTHFGQKVFARWNLPSGKFRLFGPLVWALPFWRMRVSAKSSENKNLNLMLNKLDSSCCDLLRNAPPLSTCT